MYLWDGQEAVSPSRVVGKPYQKHAGMHQQQQKENFVNTVCPNLVPNCPHSSHAGSSFPAGPFPSLWFC